MHSRGIDSNNTNTIFFLKETNFQKYRFCRRSFPPPLFFLINKLHLLSVKKKATWNYAAFHGLRNCSVFLPSLLSSYLYPYIH